MTIAVTGRATKALPQRPSRRDLAGRILKPLGISQNTLARAAKVPPRRIIEIILGKRGISADTAIQLNAALGTGEHFRLGLQADRALGEAHRALGNQIARIEAARCLTAQQTPLAPAFAQRPGR